MDDNQKKSVTSSTLTFGTVLATVVSYTTWHSIGWAIIHGALGWLYIIYFMLRYY